MKTIGDAALRRALAAYRRMPPGARLHNWVRALTCPFPRIETFVPREGDICDLGCGHGLFSIYLALRSPGRRVAGYDLDGEKISIARRAARGVPNVSFEEADILAQELVPCDAAALTDVLYLMDDAAQDRIIARCHALLREGGTLVVHTSDTRPRWKYRWALGQELLAVKLLGITRGRTLNFRPAGELEAVFDRVGFTTRMERLDRGYPYPHILFACVK
ncbi:MAG: class I SAM-dependent methyltransferase [Chlamydiota bacterium]